MPQNILLAANDSNFGDSLKELFEKRGYKVTLVGDGISLLESIDDVEPAVIIAEREIPLVCGIDALRRLRATPDRARYPVIVYSDRVEFASEVLSLGGKFVSKKAVDAIVVMAGALAHGWHTISCVHA